MRCARVRATGHNVVFAILLLGCEHAGAPAHQATASSEAPASAPGVMPAPSPAVAPPPPASPPPTPAAPPGDAGLANAPADAVTDARAEDPEYAIYDHDTIGPLRSKMTDRQLIAVLGKPRTKGAPSEEAASGMWVASWTWAGASALMMAETQRGPWTARDVSVRAPASYKTQRGAHPGSTRAEIERLYPLPPDADPPQDPDIYIAGSVYGGMMFSFQHDRVASITLGVFAY